MGAWWNSLSVLQQTLFVIGCSTTLFMIVQIVMMLIGAGDTDADVCGADADLGVDGDVSVEDDGACTGHGEGFTVFGLKVLTVRSFIAFFAIGSWVAFTVDFAMPAYGSVPIGLVAGLAAALGMAYAMNAVLKLQNDGNIDLNNAVGQTAEVYLSIPPARTGTGKVNLFLQERYIEADAVTDGADSIPTGATARIVSLADNQTVLVEPSDGTRFTRNRQRDQRDVGSG